MRNTDDPNPPFQRPLGEKVTPPKPPEPQWKPTSTPGIEKSSDGSGRIRTNIPRNEL